MKSQILTGEYVKEVMLISWLISDAEDLEYNVQTRKLEKDEMAGIDDGKQVNRMMETHHHPRPGTYIIGDRAIQIKRRPMKKKDRLGNFRLLLARLLQ